MAQETNQTQVLCSNGCGFYGNPRNSGMCSVCYKDSLQRQNNSGRSSDPVSSSLSSKGESMTSQSTSQHEQNSQCYLTSTGTFTHKDGASIATQSDLKTPETQSSTQRNTPSSSGETLLPPRSTSLEEATSRGKRKRDETLTTEEKESGESAAAEPALEEPERSKPKKNRCFTCRKKLGLTGFNCRCGQLFCGVHRYSDVHSCSFDYKADAAEKIRKENPLVVGEKIKKI
ncbi:hypothetical protein DNTS_005768 [Danionella cerebrum]|uniref:AN1-type domain-containing protein n=1 Tax=Danionella cerebrum TaxID=2873325 RepID=A0A553PIU7_9TELE|nr:hypothetical protein DNTS_005768 [Danionella translucida]